MLLELQRIIIPPGQKILLKNVDWLEFEKILKELGEHRSSRIAYNDNTLEIMVPLSPYERDKVLISNLIESLLEELELDFWCLGSTTFKSEQMLQGIEPDNCYYIKNEALVRKKDKLDLTTDPPPDLALEIDVTSRTHPRIYESLKVPELWRFEYRKLQINILQDGQYVEVEESPLFPGYPLKEAIPEFLERCKQDGRNKTMKAFREWVRDNKV